MEEMNVTEGNVVEDNKEEGLATVSEDGNVESYQQERDEILELRDQVENRYWVFGEKLANIYDNSLYLNWGFEKWTEYVASELDFDLRKAQYLVKLQNWLKKMPENICEFMHQIGWTKARLLMRVITPENFDNWKSRVEGKTTAQIVDILNDGSRGGEEEGVEEGGEEGGASESTREQERREKFTFSCVGNQIPICHGAIERAMEIGETDNRNQAFSLICAEFQAGNTTNLNVSDYLDVVSKFLGLKIVAIKIKEGNEEDEVVYGYDYIESLGTEEAE